MRKIRKKHLSQIVFRRLLAVSIGSFVALTVITNVYFFLYVRSATEREMISFLANFQEGKFGDYIREVPDIFAKQIDEGLAEYGTGYFEQPEFLLKASEMITSDWCSEWNVVDENGIILASSREDYVGFDMHSGEQSAEFLCLLNGEDYYFQDFREISYDNTTRMLYEGVPLHGMKGFVQIGFDEEMYKKNVREIIKGPITIAVIGTNGYMLLLDDQNQVINSSQDRFTGETLILSKSLEELGDRQKLTYQNAFGIPSYLLVIPFNGFYVASGMPLVEVYTPFIIIFLVLVLIYAAVFIALFLLNRQVITRQVVKGVYSLDETLSRITEGNLEEKADFRNSIEFEDLSEGINHTVGRLKEMIGEAERKMEEELAFAKRIQTSAVPAIFPPFPEKESFGLYAMMDTAKAVGGDFYDFFLINDHTLALVMADVSDKGMPAALFMMRAKTLIKTFAEQGLPVEEVATKTNLALCEENDAEMFVTAWIGFLNLENGKLSYVHAGHTKPVVLGETGARHPGCKKNTVLGAADFCKYDRQELELQHGESLLLYTDGVTEAMNPEKEMYGEKRLLKFVRKADAIGESDRNAYAKEQCRKVYEDVKAFAGGTDQSDDITLLWFYYV